MSRLFQLTVNREMGEGMGKGKRSRIIESNMDPGGVITWILLSPSHR